MRTLFISALFLTASNCFSQSADVNDYRRKNEGFSHITDKSMRSDLSCFTIGGIEESMGKGKLKEIPVKEYGNDFITFDSNQIRVTIKAAPFFTTKHKLAKEEERLVKIDNRPYYGNYGKTPTTTIGKVIVVIGKDTLPIPDNAWAALYNPNFIYRENGVVKTKDAVYLSEDKRTFYIYMLNKDDTGSYEVTWIIQDKHYLKRVIDYGFTQ